MNKIGFDDRVKPKNVLALNEKVAAIRRYEKDPVYKSVGRYFNCSPDQIKRIIKQKEAILAEWNNRTKKTVVPTALELKSVKLSFLGKAVHEWIRRMMYYTDFTLSDVLIQTMAMEFKKALGLQNFFPDANWITNFRNTYGLKNVSTKTLDIAYQESLSVQIRDILRHLHARIETDKPEKMEVCESVSTICTDSAKLGFPIKLEPLNNSRDELKDQPSCSSTVFHPVQKPQMLSIVPSLIVVPINPIKLETGTVRELKPTSVELVKEDISINTHQKAINCVKMLEDFALLKENFRLIGLIERLEEALKEKP